STLETDVAIRIYSMISAYYNHNYHNKHRANILFAQRGFFLRKGALRAARYVLRAEC
ncbi:MAG: hypothetical protein ACI856_002177, partial [Kiritimatiellia bacterium]